MTADRSRDVSDELTEVRTVLSRAETALALLAYYDQRRGQPELRWEKDSETGKFGWVNGEFETDPDIKQMELALRVVVNALAPWRKHGATGSTRRRRWITGVS